jgi:peptidyl-prolyl cis-trans isomerase B (cyclophilin B)
MTKTVELITSAGTIRLELDDAKAPKTVANFLAYVHSGHYEGTVFHRVIKGFMIQGGGMTADMSQKSTRDTIPNEANNGLKNDKYTIAMARTSAPHSASAQFFINATHNDFLNFKSETPSGWGYAVFGKVVAGSEVVDAIEKVRTGRKGYHDDVPLEPITITKAVEVSAQAEQAAAAQDQVTITTIVEVERTVTTVVERTESVNKSTN